MKRFRHRAACLLAALALTVCCGTARGAEHRTGSLRVTLTDGDDRGVKGVTVALFRAAEPDGSLTEDFRGAGVPAESLLSQRNAAANARTLADWAEAQSLSGTEAVTDRHGQALFSGLSRGVYLALCPEGQDAVFSPFLVTVPLTAGGTERFDVTASPKAETPGKPGGGGGNRPPDPGTPEEPEEPDEPGKPDSPAEPEEPSLPQTGRDPLPAYVLLACGGVLALAGLWELRPGRERDE